MWKLAVRVFLFVLPFILFFAAQRAAAQMWNEVVCTIKGRKFFASDDDGAGVDVEDKV